MHLTLILTPKTNLYNLGSRMIGPQCQRMFRKLGLKVFPQTAISLKLSNAKCYHVTSCVYLDSGNKRVGEVILPPC